MNSDVTRITFPGSQGDELAARLDTPSEGEPRASVIFAHCFTCGKDVKAASRIATGLTDNGFEVLRFDFTGLGSSDGDFENTNFTSNVDDLVAAADMMTERFMRPAVLIGHSLGGAAVLAATARIPSVRAAVTIAAPTDPGHVLHLFDDSTIDTIKTDGRAEVQLAGRPFAVQDQFLTDVCEQNLPAIINNLGRPVLVMHSPVDNTVGIENARGIFEAARHPKAFVSIDGADHMLSNPDDASYVADVIAAWANRYVD